MPIRVRDKRTGRIEMFPDGTSRDAIRARMSGLRREDPTDASAGVEPETQATVPFAQRALPFAMRLGAPLAAGVGAALTAPATFGASLMGIPAAVAAGSGLGEYAAQEYERSIGQREDLNPTQIAAQTALGLIPISKAGQALTLGQRMFRRGAHGTLLGAGAAGVTEAAETGEFPRLSTLGTGAAFGGVLGAGGGALEARGLRRRSVTPETETAVQPERVVLEKVNRIGVPDTAKQPEFQPLLPFEEFSQQQQTVAMREAVAGTPIVKAGQETVVLNAKKPSFVGKPIPGDPDYENMFATRWGKANFKSEADRVDFEALMNQSPIDIRTVKYRFGREFDAESAKYVNVGATIEDIWKPGQAKSSVELTRLGAELKWNIASKNVLERELVRKGTLPVEDAMLLARIDGRIGVLMPALEGSVSEAGRSLNAVKGLLDPQFMDEVIKRIQSDPQEFLKYTKTMQQRVLNAIEAKAFENDPVGMIKFLRSKTKPGVGDKLRSYFYANVLSSEKTQIRNILGTATSVFARIPSKIIGSGIDWVQSAATGAERTMFLSEVPPAFVATFKGMRQGMSDMAYAWKNGFTRHRFNVSYKKALQGRFDKTYYELGGGLANPLNYPARALMAADAFFRSMAYNQELVGSSWSRALREVGKKDPGKFNKRLQELIADPKVKEAAEEASVEAVFQTELGSMGRRLQSLIQGVPGGFLILPFVRIAGNLLKQGIQMSPAGALTPVGRGVTGTARQIAHARGAAGVGTLAMFPLALLALEGKVSGRGPRDRTERARLFESGWRPHSVNVGGTWYDYRLLQPIGVPMAIVANAFEAYRESGQGDEESATDVVTDIVMRAGSSVLDQSYLAGLSDFLTAVEQGESNPERFRQFIGRTGSAFIPGSSQLRSIAQGVDPTIRKPRGIAEAGMVGIPGLSQQLQPRVTRFGEPVQRLGGFMRRKSLPVDISPEVREPVADELSRLGVRVGLPSPRLTLPGDMKLTREEEGQLVRVKGQRLRETIDRFMTNPTYQQLSDDSKRKVIERIKRRSNAQSNKMFRNRIVRERRGR